MKHLAALLLTGMLAGWTVPAQADQFSISFYDNAGASVTLPPVFPLSTGNFTALENFGGQPIGSNNSFTTDFGTAGHVMGSYSGNFSIQPLPDPAHTGNAIAAGESGTVFTLSLGLQADVPGINFFGLDINTIDPGAAISFLNSGFTILTVSGSDIMDYAGGSLMDGTGRPNLVAFVDQTGTFDQIEFSGAGMFVSDNHVIGTVASAGLFDSTPVDEPTSASILGVGLIGVGASRMWRKRTG